jgi:hypothetical protein
MTRHNVTLDAVGHVCAKVSLETPPCDGFACVIIFVFDNSSVITMSARSFDPTLDIQKFVGHTLEEVYVENEVLWYIFSEGKYVQISNFSCNDGDEDSCMSAWLDVYLKKALMVPQLATAVAAQ